MLSDFTHPKIRSDLAAPGYEERIPVKIGIGLSLGVDTFLLNIDAEYVNQQANFRFGTETWVLDNKLGLRAGLQFWDGVYGVDFTLGAGYKISQYLSVDYGFLFPLAG